MKANQTKHVPMTVQAASRIYAATAQQNGGLIPRGSHAARAMRAAMKNANIGSAKKSN